MKQVLIRVIGVLIFGTFLGVCALMAPVSNGGLMETPHLTAFTKQVEAMGCPVSDPCSVTYRESSDGMTTLRVFRSSFDLGARLMLSKESIGKESTMDLTLRRYQEKILVEQSVLSGNEKVLELFDAARDFACRQDHPCDTYVGPSGITVDPRP